MKDGSVRAVLAILLLVGWVGGCTTIGHQLRHLTGGADARLADDVVIERDEWGVPHIQGRSDAAVAFGAAWAMAEDNFWQLEEGYIQALGRSAYYYGPRYLADDLVRSAFQVEALARAEYASEAPSFRALLDGFAHGLNYYLRKHPVPGARVIPSYEGWMVLARARRVAAAQSVGGLRLGEIAGLLGERDAGGRAEAEPGRGSAWAVAPSGSASKTALLLASVDAAFQGSEQAYELELRSQSGWHVYGLAQLGIPVPFTGHNDQHAWARARVADAAAVRRIVLGNPGDSLAYRDGGGWQRLEPFADTLSVNTANGVEQRTYRFLRTREGPVIARRGDTAWVVHLPGVGEGGAIQQWQAMGQARTLEEFMAALDRGGVRGLATAYADVEGNILADSGRGSPAIRNPPDGEIRLGGAESNATARPGGGWTAAELGALALGFDGTPPSAEILQLVQEWEQVGGRNSRRAFAMDTAVELLRRWDHAAIASTAPGTVEGAKDSAAQAAATLFRVWQDLYGEQQAHAEAAATTIAPLDPYPRFRALEEAVARMRRDWGTIQVPWSEAARLQRRQSGVEEPFRDELPSVGIGGLPDGSLFALQTVPGNGRRRYGWRGTAAVLVTELARPPRTRSVVAYGQSADTASPHFFDQASRYAAGQLKDAGWLNNVSTSQAARSEPGGTRRRYHPGQRAQVLQGETTAR